MSIITSMKSHRLGRNMTDGELLTSQQTSLRHCFFATLDNDASNAHFFIIKLDATAADRTLAVKASDELSWVQAARGQQFEDKWTQTVALIDEASLDARMRAQSGKFLVGSLDRRSAGRFMYLSKSDIGSESYPEVTSLSINFRRPRRVTTSAS
ncbi:MAG TPA: hypothetical protein VNG12_03725 [Acidimicrobiales bacterium]|nr:hypothetical protein [Acidimicrobiales bacterium]